MEDSAEQILHDNETTHSVLELIVLVKRIVDLLHEDKLQLPPRSSRTNRPERLRWSPGFAMHRTKPHGRASRSYTALQIAQFLNRLVSAGKGKAPKCHPDLLAALDLLALYELGHITQESMLKVAVGPNWNARGVAAALKKGMAS